MPRVLLLLSLVVWLGFSSLGHADVKDGGGFFKPATITRADEVIKDIKSAHKLDVAVETFATIPKDKMGGSRR